jgi:hypothetical protein
LTTTRKVISHRYYFSGQVPDVTRAENVAAIAVSVQDHRILARGKRDARIGAAGWRRPRVIGVGTALYEEES